MYFQFLCVSAITIGFCIIAAILSMGFGYDYITVLRGIAGFIVVVGAAVGFLAVVVVLSLRRNL